MWGNFRTPTKERGRSRSPPRMRPRALKFEEAGAMDVDAVTSTRNTTEIGEPLGHCDKKKCVTWAGHVYGSGTLTEANTVLNGEDDPASWCKHYYNTLYYSKNLFAEIKFGTSINMRKEACIDVSGITIDVNALNNNVAQCTELHYAVVIAKPGAVPGTDSGIKTDFFRHYGTSTGRDFNNSGTGLYALSGMELCNNPINTDIWHVVTHKKALLGAGVCSTSALNPETWNHKCGDGGTATNIHFAKLYVPINKQIRFQNPAGGTVVPQDDIRLVWWFALPFTYGVPKSVSDGLPSEELTQLQKAYYAGINQTAFPTWPYQPQCLFHSRAIVTYKDS